MQARESSPAETSKASRILAVKNKMGIHARPAAMIVRLANKYNDTEMVVIKEDEEINGKSIMGLMMLAAGKGTSLTFNAEGTHSKKLLDEIEDLFNRKFEEA